MSQLKLQSNFTKLYAIASGCIVKGKAALLLYEELGKFTILVTFLLFFGNDF